MALDRLYFYMSSSCQLSQRSGRGLSSRVVKKKDGISEQAIRIVYIIRMKRYRLDEEVDSR